MFLTRCALSMPAKPSNNLNFCHIDGKGTTFIPDFLELSSAVINHLNCSSNWINHSIFFHDFTYINVLYTVNASSRPSRTSIWCYNFASLWFPIIQHFTQLPHLHDEWDELCTMEIHIFRSQYSAQPHQWQNSLECKWRHIMQAIIALVMGGGIVGTVERRQIK